MGESSSLVSPGLRIGVVLLSLSAASDQLLRPHTEFTVRIIPPPIPSPVRRARCRWASRGGADRDRQPNFLL